MHKYHRRGGFLLPAVCILVFQQGAYTAPIPLSASSVTASSTAPGSSPAGATDGDRFAVTADHSWRGKPAESSWWWQIDFRETRQVGAILLISGDHPLCRRNAPKKYVWQASFDGKAWQDLRETAVRDERRTFRIQRLKEARKVRYLRLYIEEADGAFPVLREVEFYSDANATIAFPHWTVVVSTTGEKKVPGAGTDFIRLARSCKGWETIQAQNVWLGDFDEAYLAVEPRPLCAFLSGNFIDWCQQERQDWRGVQEVLKNGRLPMWAACGGAQGLSILAETGIEQPWDCPQCRDPARPRLPIYTHITGSKKVKCGDYSSCIFERGPHTIVQIGNDPVFAGLGRTFRTMESHCGQIGWAPKGWVQIATCGPEGKTKVQCLRLRDRLVYAAQFHIEMEGTPDSSRQIMGNFLRLAEEFALMEP
jgi:hypothetical protein